MYFECAIGCNATASSVQLLYENVISTGPEVPVIVYEAVPEEHNSYDISMPAGKFEVVITVLAASIKIVFNQVKSVDVLSPVTMPVGNEFDASATRIDSPAALPMASALSMSIAAGAVLMLAPPPPPPSLPQPASRTVVYSIKPKLPFERNLAIDNALINVSTNMHHY